MKALVFVSMLALVSPAAMADGDWDCGSVNGKSVEVHAGPSLYIEGIPHEMRMYHNDGATAYYVTADGQYIWGGSARATGLYTNARKFLASCQRPSDGSSWWDRLFEDNGYGGDRGEEFP